MRNLKSIFLIIILGIFGYSCIPCSSVKCSSGYYSGQFRIVSATDGKDLVFGSNSVYDKNLIKFYSIKGIDTTFFDYKTQYFPNIGYDSILYVLFIPKTDIAYMRLSNGDVDTLNISYNIYNSTCCGTTTEIANFRFNNLTTIPGDKGTQEIKK